MYQECSFSSLKELCLSGNGRVMIKSSAGLTQPDCAAQLPSSVAALLSVFRLQVPGYLELFNL